VRTPEEIKRDIIDAIKEGNRCRSRIMLGANISTNAQVRKYLKILLDEGIIVEKEPNFFDHRHVKKIYVLTHAQVLQLNGGDT